MPGAVVHQTRGMSDRAETAKAHLQKSLGWARDEVLPKLDGLDEYDVRRPMTPTGLNLLGLVKHLAFYEASYFGFVFGRPFPEPIPTVDETFRNEEMMCVPASESRDSVVERYRAACRHADETIGALAIDAVGRVPWWGDREVPLFNVMTHMLGETRQHLGHMDLIREQLDGRFGEDVEALTPDEAADYARLWRRTEKAARVAGHRFVPDGFQPPTSLLHDLFRLEPLGPQHNVADHAAWTSNIDHVRATPGYGGDWPPAAGMTLEENLSDLEMHARDFAARSGFTFTVLDPADGDVIGCVYLYPAADEHDVEVRSWVRADRAGLDVPLADAVREWLGARWPWTRVAYVGR